MTLDLSAPGQLMTALGPDLLLMTGAMILLLWSAWKPESETLQRQIGVASIILCVTTIVAIGYYMAKGDSVGPGIIAMDNFRWTADIVFLIATIGTIALSMDYNARQGITGGESHVLLLFATSGMMTLAAARDLIIVFLGIEIMSIAVYVLAGLNRRSERSAEGAIKYFLLGAFSTAFLLYGIALVYGAAASTNLVTIGSRVHELGLHGSALMAIGGALLLVGFGFKVAAAPFHMWAPDVYEGAPTPVTAYMAAAVKAAAYAAFLRVWLEAFPAISDQWHGAVWWLAAATMIVGNLIALAQKNIKRMLAYSSIAHAGYIMMAVAIGTPAAVGAFMFYILAYTLATLGAFGVIVAQGEAGESHLNIDDYSGLWFVQPRTAVAMAIFMLALLGFPLFGGIGFLAKYWIIQSALQAPQPQTKLAVILVVTSVVSAGYYLYVIMVMFMRQRQPDAFVAPRAGGWTRFVIAAAAVLIIVLGILPNSVVRWTERSKPAVAAVVILPTAQASP
ncbi:MAG TPA: NADH-quinone oxidoreductase subunit N [Gemmatimonadaceae bacterium]|jgi:NADH-quinone oxidoreductase subunit N|nr:NADH-quinone oxidoreductase subunit N [Gemmatimonadaceae bacterium]